MALIRATCEDCGDVELRSSSLQLRICNDLGGAATYLFRCPECTMVEVRPCQDDVFEVLVSAGVSVARWCLPNELGENLDLRSSEKRFTPDEQIDFHNLLDDPAAVDAALRQGRG